MAPQWIINCFPGNMPRCGSLEHNHQCRVRLPGCKPEVYSTPSRPHGRIFPREPVCSLPFCPLLDRCNSLCRPGEGDEGFDGARPENPEGGAISKFAFSNMPSLLGAVYLFSAVCFILCLRGLSTPQTAKRGNILGYADFEIANFEHPTVTRFPPVLWAWLPPL